MMVTTSELGGSKAVKDEAATFRLISELTGDLILRFDLASKISFASPSAKAILGYAPREMVGRRTWRFVHPDDHAALTECYSALLQDGVRSQVVTYRAITADGGVRILESKPSVIRDQATGKIIGFIDVARDITERAEMARRLEAAVVEARQAAEAKATFLANMSHELRTPLTAVIGYSQLIQVEEGLSAAVRTAAERIAVGGRSLLSTINDILDISRLDAGGLVIESAPTSLDPLFRETIGLMRNQAEEKGLALGLIGLEELPPFASVDGSRLRQVVTNLVGNAIKFSETGAVRVHVSYDPAASELTVYVRDNGPGLSPEHAARVFERFRQADASVARRFGGSGLGLSICKGLVEAMGGEIGVESALGEGACFWCRLPAPRVDPVAGPEGQLGLPSGRRVLAVDDNQENLEIVRVMLNAFGLEVVTASSGAEALEAVTQSAFDVILMDMHMPGMDGAATARKIRSERTPNQHAPILLCSADGDSVHGDVAHLFDGAILKPFSPGNLLGRLVAVIDPDPLAVAVGD